MTASSVMRCHEYGIWAHPHIVGVAIALVIHVDVRCNPVNDLAVSSSSSAKLCHVFHDVRVLIFIDVSVMKQIIEFVNGPKMHCRVRCHCQVSVVNHHFRLSHVRECVRVYPTNVTRGFAHPIEASCRELMRCGSSSFRCLCLTRK